MLTLHYPIFFLGIFGSFVFLYNTARDTTDFLLCDIKTICIITSSVGIIFELDRAVNVVKSTIIMWDLQLIKKLKYT